MHPIVGLVTSFLALTIPLVLLARISFLGKGERKDSHSLSVIIPARNEEKRIVPLLESLRSQSVRPSEVCVVDDSSTDQTAEIVKKHGYRVVQCPILPEGWTGKSWACWNGVHSTEGELLLFLDADVTLKKDALERLLFEYERTGGLISVQPFHLMSRFHEYFSAFQYDRNDVHAVFFFFWKMDTTPRGIWSGDPLFSQRLSNSGWPRKDPDIHFGRCGVGSSLYCAKNSGYSERRKGEHFIPNVPRRVSDPNGGVGKKLCKRGIQNRSGYSGINDCDYYRMDLYIDRICAVACSAFSLGAYLLSSRIYMCGV